MVKRGRPDELAVVVVGSISISVIGTRPVPLFDPVASCHGVFSNGSGSIPRANGRLRAEICSSATRTVVVLVFRRKSLAVADQLRYQVENQGFDLFL